MLNLSWVGFPELFSKPKIRNRFSKPNSERGPSCFATEPHAREGKFFAQPSICITGRRKGWCRGAVITAVVAAGMIWMIVFFWRKRTFDCSRPGSAIGPFTPHSRQFQAANSIRNLAPVRHNCGRLFLLGVPDRPHEI